MALCWVSASSLYSATFADSFKFHCFTNADSTASRTAGLAAAKQPLLAAAPADTAGAATGAGADALPCHMLPNIAAAMAAPAGPLGSPAAAMAAAANDGDDGGGGGGTAPAGGGGGGACWPCGGGTTEALKTGGGAMQTLDRWPPLLRVFLLLLLLLLLFPKSALELSLLLSLASSAASAAPVYPACT